MKLPAYKVLAPAKIKPWPGNPRTHTGEQLEQIRRSIVEFGFTNPLLIDERNKLIAGHGRLEAANLLKLTEVPVIVLRGLTEAQKKAYLIADNQLALNAAWDMQSLSALLKDLDASDFDLSLTGLADTDALLAWSPDGMKAGKTDPDDAPGLPAKPTTRAGEIWIAGAHRIGCGDSTDAALVGRVLGPVKPHLMVTDPPYGVEYDAVWRGKARNADGSQLSTGKHRATGKVGNDDRADWCAAWQLFPGDVAYVWHSALRVGVTQASLEAADFAVRCQLVWVKSQAAISRGHYHWQHEACWYAVRAGRQGHWAGDRTQTSVWQIDKHLKSETGHSTQKPVACMLRPMLNNSTAGQAVYDPFVGSGTSVIAAEQSQRACYAVEIEPAYVDVAVQRWQAFTGQDATLDGGGKRRTFAQLQAERSK